VRWLRQESQAPTSNLTDQSSHLTPQQTSLEVDDDQSTLVAPIGIRPWPKELSAQAAALSEVLQSLTAPADVDTIAACFEGKQSKKRLEEIARLLETLEALGRARKMDGGWVGV
jgi:hypothetical protein